MLLSQRTRDLPPVVSLCCSSQTTLTLGGFSTHPLWGAQQLVWLECEVLVGLLENFFLASWLTATSFCLSYWLFWSEICLSPMCKEVEKGASYKRNFLWMEFWRSSKTRHIWAPALSQFWVQTRMSLKHSLFKTSWTSDNVWLSRAITGMLVWEKAQLGFRPCMFQMHVPWFTQKERGSAREAEKGHVYQVVPCACIVRTCSGKHSAGSAEKTGLSSLAGATRHHLSHHIRPCSNFVNPALGGKEESRVATSQ